MPHVKVLSWVPVKAARVFVTKLTPYEILVQQVLAPEIHASSMHSLRLSLWIAALCTLLLPAYLHGARCCD